MTFRKWLFRGLTGMTVLYVLAGILITQAFNSDVTAVASSTGEEAAAWVVQTGMFALVLCTGLPMMLLFAILAHRNARGLRDEQRHQETLRAIQQGHEG